MTRKVSTATALDRPPLMSHEDRQRLIRAPFHTLRTGGKSWGGVNLRTLDPQSQVGNSWTTIREELASLYVAAEDVDQGEM